MFIHKDARIGKNVVLGEGCIVRSNAIIEDDVFVGPFSIIGEAPNDSFKDKETRVGKGSLIRSHSIIYSDVSIGEAFQSGHRITIRENTKIGTHTRIGTLCDIQGNCEIGDYVSLHSNVHICQGSVIKNFVWIFPYTVLTNDPFPPSDKLKAPVIEEFAVIATRCTLMPGVRIGKDALVGACSLVTKDVKPEMVVIGSPAREYCSIREIKDKETDKYMYPWREHFRRGMPWEI